VIPKSIWYKLRAIPEQQGGGDCRKKCVNEEGEAQQGGTSFLAILNDKDIA